MKKYILFICLPFVALEANSVYECKNLETTWLTYDKMAGKAFLKELDITKAVNLKVLATDTANNILDKCPDEYWLSSNTEDDNHTVSFWKDDMAKYIQRNNQFIKKHRGI